MEKTMLMKMLTTIAFPKVRVAYLFLCSPIRIDTMAQAPAPTNVLKATAKFIIGKVSASPAMASGPTPLPMKIRSIMLYSELAQVAIIAGMAYSKNNFLISLCARAEVDRLLYSANIDFFMRQKYKFNDKRCMINDECKHFSVL